jgi:thiol-disulfide isomerase/thioredoxin
VRILAASVLAVSLCGAAGAGSPPRVQTVTPAEYRSKVVAPHLGRVLVVNFWATWCVPCREEMPALASAARKMSGQAVDVVLVSADALPAGETAVSEYLRKASVALPCFIESARDPEDFIDAVDKSWGGELPHTIVYGRDGKSLVSVSDAQTEEGFVRLMRRGLAHGM